MCLCVCLFVCLLVCFFVCFVVCLFVVTFAISVCVCVCVFTFVFCWEVLRRPCLEIRLQFYVLSHALGLMPQLFALAHVLFDE